MGRVHEVAIGANAQAFDRGIRSGVIAPLEAAEKALDALGDSKGPSALEGDLKDAQRATERLADDTKDTARQIERSYKDAGRDIKKGIGSGLDEAKTEAKQSGREAAASFSGGFDDVTDFVQETAANAFGGFGPIGAAAGIAAAAGIGIVGAELGKQQEQIDAMKQRFADMYQAAAEEGLNYVSTASIVANAQDLMFNPDRANEWKDVQADALRIGLDANTVALARNGHEESLNTVLEATKQKREQIKTTAEEGGSTAIRLATDEVSAMDTLRREYEFVGQVQEQNKANLQNAHAIKNQLSEEERAQIQRTRDADQARYEALAAQASTPLRIPVYAELSQAENDVANARARWQRSINIHVGVSGVNQVI